MRSSGGLDLNTDLVLLANLVLQRDIDHLGLLLFRFSNLSVRLR
jgi:hypothetical protein